MGVPRSHTLTLFVLACLFLAACGQAITDSQATSVPFSGSVKQATSAPMATIQPTAASMPAPDPTQAVEPTPAPAAKVLDWSNVSELQGSTFEFFTSTHVPGNTQPFAGWVSVMDLFNAGAEQPKGTLAVYSDTEPESYVSDGGDSMLIFVTCRELDPNTGKSANNKRTLIFAILEGSTEAYVVPEIITVHSFNYRGDARVDWGEQFKLLGNQGHPEDELWPAEGAFVLHLANGKTLTYKYVAGLNIHYPDGYEISPFAVIDTKAKYADQLQALLGK